MTLCEIISDALATEGALDELTEEALREEVSNICSDLDLRCLLHDAVRDAVHKRRDCIEDAITEQLEITVEGMVEAYI